MYEDVFELQKLGKFDDHLPVNRSRRCVTDDIDGKPPVHVNHLQPITEASVFDIWGDVSKGGNTGHIHPLEVMGLTEMALMLGNRCTGTIMEASRLILFNMGARTAMVDSREEKT